MVVSVLGPSYILPQNKAKNQGNVYIIFSAMYRILAFTPEHEKAALSVTGAAFSDLNGRLTKCV